MTDSSVAPIEYLRSLGTELDGASLRQSIGLLAQMLMELQAEQRTRAKKANRLRPHGLRCRPPGQRPASERKAGAPPGQP